MPSLHVCSLSRLEATVARTDASHVATLINAGTPVTRPPRIAPENHLFLGFNDITTPTEGLISASSDDVARFLAFVRGWDRARPMVIHCWAGISRSTAGAYIASCALMPYRDEGELAMDLRRLSPSATPNAHLVRLADAMLGRQGRMITAITTIGRGADAFEGVPFEIPVVAR